MADRTLGYVHLGKDFDRYIKNLDGAIDDGMKFLGDEIKDDIIDTMSQAKHGLWYGKHGRRSAPGESPAVQTGELADSIFNKPHEAKGKVSRAIGTDLKYGYELEVGRPVAKEPFGPFEARPWLAPQLIKLNDSRMAKALRRFVKHL